MSPQPWTAAATYIRSNQRMLSIPTAEFSICIRCVPPGDLVSVAGVSMSLSTEVSDISNHNVVLEGFEFTDDICDYMSFHHPLVI